MLLLHVSDIHFRHPRCNTEYDPDRPYRTLLVQDVQTRVRDLGPVDAILVGGDIAFQGIQAEYVAAFAWLQELAHVSECPLERIYVIPGNHDIDRDVIRNSEEIQALYSEFLKVNTSAARERLFWKYLMEASTGSSIYAPLADYNAFAAKFDCQVYPKRPFWKQELKINDHVALRIFGLTSTFLCASHLPDRGDDDLASLYLSPYQTVLNPDMGTVNLVLCHHPPSWLADGDDVEDAVGARATIHMFGHRHRQRVHCDTNYVRFSAAAVNPDRHEVGWEPGYNLISLGIGNDAQGVPRLDVSAHLIKWQTNPDKFVAKQDSEGGSVFSYQLPVRAAPITTTRPKTAPTAPTPVAVEHSEVKMAEVNMSESSLRNLVLRFWALPASGRRDIALKLQLIDHQELKLPEPERYGHALLRAGERGLLQDVAKEIERMEARHGG